MIIVSGEPRSGTSLMMETVRLLGTPVWGHEQPGEKQREEKREKIGREITLEEKLRKEKAEWMNDKFWEVGGLVMKGVKRVSMIQRKLDIETSAMPDEDKKKQIEMIDHFVEEVESHKDDAVKIIWNGLIQTDRDILESSKIILCLRDPLHIANSQTNLETSISAPTIVDGEKVFQSIGQSLSPFRYLTSASAFVQWIKQPMNKKLKILQIDYDDMQFKTQETIEKIARFIGCSDEVEIQEAIKNVNPSKRRSASVEEPDEHREEWVLVREIYEAIKEGEYNLVQARIEDYQVFQRNNPNNARWLDEETFFPINVSLHRDMIESPELKAKMKNSKERRERSGLLCASCPLYNRNGDIYTVKLPSDLEDIERNKVDCAEFGKQVTLEECQQHWQSIQHDPGKLKQHRGEIRNFKYGGCKSN